MKLPSLALLHSVLIASIPFILIESVGAYPKYKRGRSSRIALDVSLPSVHHHARLGGRTSPYNSGRVVEMRNIQFRALAVILPVTQAAQALEEFFSGLATAARDEWAWQPRLPGFTYSEGGFSLAMQSWGDSIPWDFVFAIANRCWILAAQGMPYLFDLAYSSPDGRIMVSITLRLAAQAVSSIVQSYGFVSNADSGTPSWTYDVNGQSGDNLSGGDWREGSVPSVNTGQPLLPGGS